MVAEIGKRTANWWRGLYNMDGCSVPYGLKQLGLVYAGLNIMHIKEIYLRKYMRSRLRRNTTDALIQRL
jgi:hypothetical protein